MGRYCLICQCVRSNESFRGGKGPKSRTCRKCRQLPKAERAALLQAREIMGFLEQSHITKKNIARLRTLARAESPATAQLADRVLDIGTLTPYRRGRIRTLARERPELVRWLEEIGMLMPLPPPEPEPEGEWVAGFGYLHPEEVELLSAWDEALEGGDSEDL